MVYCLSLNRRRFTLEKFSQPPKSNKGDEKTSEETNKEESLLSDNYFDKSRGKIFSVEIDP